jgi:eukaryotic-like serine/threonine-protein kinase
MTHIPPIRDVDTTAADDPPEIVILQDSIRQEPGYPAKRPPSSTASAETIILPPGEEHAGSTSIRLGVIPAANHPAALPTGISSTNKFTLVEELGRGGMGIILRGRDKVLHRDVALKVIRDHGDDVQRERFIKEAQVTGQLEHPNIVPVHEFGVDHSGRIFFAMKLVRGRTLGEVLDGHRAGDEAVLRDFPLSRLVSILVQVCHAVAFAHSRGVIHRDLKPSNIMLGDFGEVQLMDWGLAKVGVVDVAEPAGVGEETRIPGERPVVRRLDDTQDGSVLGTPVYMPPEQALGRIGALDARSDVYALGAILYEVLTLRTPIEGEDVKEVLYKVARGEVITPEQAAPERDIPRDLSAVAMKALSYQPEHRYMDAGAMRRDLELFLDGRMVSAREDNVIEVLARFIRRHRIASLVVGTTVVLLLTVATVGYLANDAQRRRALEERQRAEALQRAAEENQARAIASSTVAEQERQRAIAAQQQAEEHRRIADLARERASVALESESRLRLRSEQTAHLAALSLASEQIARRDYDAARASLDACPVRLRDWAWRRLALLCHRHLAQFNDHVGAVRHLAVGDGGRLVAAAGDDGSVVVSDLAGRQRIAELMADATALGMAHGRPLLVLAEDEVVRLIDVRTGQEQGRLPLPGVTTVAAAPDGTLVALGDSNGGVWWWDTATGHHRAGPHLPEAIGVLVLDGADGLIAGTRTGAVVACRADGMQRWRHELPGRILALAPQGLAVVRDDRSGAIAVLDAAGGTVLAKVAGNHAQVAGAVFSDDGQRFALLGDDRTARVFASGDASPVVTLEGHAGALFAAGFTDGHARLLTGAADGSVRLWDATRAVDIRQLASPGEPGVTGHDTAGANGLIARADGTVRAIRLLDRRPAWEIAIGFTAHATANAVSRVVLAGNHGQVRVLDLRSGEVLAEHGLGTATLQAIVCDASASRLVALDEDGWLRGLDRASGARFSTRVLPAGRGALCLVDDGRHVLAAGAGGMLTWCSTTDGTVVRREDTPAPAIVALASARDGQVLALAGADRVVLWNSATRQTAVVLRGHAGEVNDIAFNHDGTRLVTAGQDGTVRLWDVATGRALLVLDAHPGGVRSARLIGGDRELLTVGRDGRILGWLALDRQSWD